MKRLILAAFLPLAACGTPQEQCISQNTRDLRVVDRLIAETEGNLARGYGYKTVTEYEPRWINCAPRATTAAPSPAPQLCFKHVPVEARKEVALDLKAEASKLSGLKAKRRSLAKAAEGVVAQCKAGHPE